MLIAHCSSLGLKAALDFLVLPTGQDLVTAEARREKRGVRGRGGGYIEAYKLRLRPQIGGRPNCSGGYIEAYMLRPRPNCSLAASSLSLKAGSWLGRASLGGRA